MDAESFYRAGKLSEAVDAAIATVKSAPNQIGARLFLAELLCFQGEWERAEKQFDAAAHQSQDDSLFALLMRQLIRGEVLREQVFNEGRPPQLVGELPRDASLQLEICAALRAGQMNDAAKMVVEAQEIRHPISGVSDEQPFDDIRDLDDRIAGIAEVITTTGKYYWVPWHSIRMLELPKPERPADLIWRKASIEVEDGPEGDVYIPVRYPCPNGPGWDDQLRLGRATSWSGESEGVVTGLGQRMLLIGEHAKGILEIDRIAVAPKS